MKLIQRFQRWRAIRRHERHIRWLRKMKVVIHRPPHHTTRRNGPESV